MFHQNAPNSKECSYQTMIEWWEYWLWQKKAELPEIESETDKNRDKHAERVGMTKSKAFNAEEHLTPSMKRCLQSLNQGWFYISRFNLISFTFYAEGDVRTHSRHRQKRRWLD
jgi:hypothetical protein